MQITLRCGHTIHLQSSRHDEKVIDAAEDRCFRCQRERNRGVPDWVEEMSIERGHERIDTEDFMRPNPVTDYTLDTPTLSYFCPSGHRIRLRDDVDEAQAFFLEDGDDPVEPMIFCRQCFYSGGLGYYHAEECSKHYPVDRAGRRYTAKRVAEKYDCATLWTRVRKMLGDRLDGAVTNGYAEMIANITGVSLRTVRNVIADMGQKVHAEEVFAEVGDAATAWLIEHDNLTLTQQHQQEAA